MDERPVAAATRALRWAKEWPDKAPTCRQVRARAASAGTKCTATESGVEAGSVVVATVVAGAITMLSQFGPKYGATPLTVFAP